VGPGTYWKLRATREERESERAQMLHLVGDIIERYSFGSAFSFWSASYYISSFIATHSNVHKLKKWIFE